MSLKVRKFLRFPNFKYKALTLSYDDGLIYDEKFLEIISKYGLKATFNICSDKLFNTKKDWYLTKEQAYKLYTKYDCEVACHGATHHPLTEVSIGKVMDEVLTCRDELEKTYKRIIRGFAYPYGVYNDEVVETLKKCGIIYARTVDDTNKFYIPEDFLRLNPTCRHQSPRLMELADEFVEPVDDTFFYNTYPRLFFVWGHTYEFFEDGNWELLENFAKKVGNKEDVWYATNKEVVEYVNAYDKLEFSVDYSFVFNPTDKDIYISYKYKDYLVPKFTRVDLI